MRVQDGGTELVSDTSSAFFMVDRPVTLRRLSRQDGRSTPGGLVLLRYSVA
ncbi:hypothetical protein [Kineosporia mesophila]|uniref:hypothetical protein n=1 Tax=Kineosporia mesophila TaxID=566012 RepID=UPI001E37B529|nr:hypothetical protein [Kineosporia mesophila]MCD5350525.1 hypothetical protein [Kineosporia mesophila]